MPDTKPSTTAHIDISGSFDSKASLAGIKKSTFNGDLFGSDVTNVKYMPEMFKPSDFTGDISKTEFNLRGGTDIAPIDPALLAALAQPKTPAFLAAAKALSESLGIDIIVVEHALTSRDMAGPEPKDTTPTPGM